MKQNAKNSESETTTVRLPIGVIADVKKVAKKRGMTQSGFIRFAIMGTMEQFKREAI